MSELRQSQPLRDRMVLTGEPESEQTVPRRTKTPTRILTLLAASALLAACGGTASSTTDAPPFADGTAVPKPLETLTPSDKIEELAEAVPEPYRHRQQAIKVGIYPSNEPWGLLQEDQTIVGFNIDMLDQLAGILDVQYEVVPTSFDQLIPGLQSGRLDMALAGIFVTPERLAQIDLVTYGVNGTSLITRAGNPDNLTYDTLCGLTVAVTAGSSQATQYMPERSEDCVSRGEPEIKILSLPDAPATMLALDSERADATDTTAIADAPLMAARNPDKYEVVETNIQVYVGAGFPKSSPLALTSRDALNEFLASDAYIDALDHWGMEGLGIQESVLNPSELTPPQAE